MKKRGRLIRTSYTSHAILQEMAKTTKKPLGRVVDEMIEENKQFKALIKKVRQI